MEEYFNCLVEDLVEEYFNCLVEESEGEGGLRRIRAELMQDAQVRRTFVQPQYKPLQAPSFHFVVHFMFHLLFHLILHCWSSTLGYLDP